MSDRPQGLRILSLDGGGVKGYASLLVLKRIFRTIVAENGLIHEPLPCDVFDLIVGTSTGGLIAIMLGRLRIMVCVTRGINSRPDVLRSYNSNHPTQQNYKCSIWEAASATAAAPIFFHPVKLAGGESFCDGGMRRNNPINEAVNELNRELEKGWAGRSLGCLVSVGTGVVEAAKVSSSLTTLMKAVVKILTDSEDVAEEFVKSAFGQQLDSTGRYFRFNVPQGLQTLQLDEWKETEKLNAATTDYLSKSGTGNLVKLCAQALNDPDALIIMPSLSNRQPRLDSPCSTYVQRPMYQTRLREYFWNYVSMKPQIFVLWGLAGVGKTQLALKFAETMKTRLNVFWIRADQSSNFIHDYAKLRPKMQPDDRLQNPAQDLSTLLEETCSELEANPAGWLLVLDNADDFDEYRQAIDPHLPRSGRILITSRDPRFQGDVAAAEDGLNVLPMDEKESIELLTKSIPGRLRLMTSETEEAPSYLVNMLGNLPLAIAQAAANIRDQQVSLRDYIKSFQDGIDPFNILRVPVWNRNTRDPRNAKQSVNKTWSVSLSRLLESSPSTVALLGYMSCLHWDAIPVDMVRNLPKFQGFSPTEFRQMVARALQLSLVQEDDLGQFSVLQMHPLVHEFAWNQVGSKDENLAAEVVSVLCVLFPFVGTSCRDSSEWAVCSFLSAHCHRAIAVSEKVHIRSKPLARLMQVFSSYLNAFGDLKSALAISTRALDLAMAVWGPQDESTLHVRNTKIGCLRSSQMYTAALEDVDRNLEYLNLQERSGAVEEVELLGKISDLLQTKEIILRDLLNYQDALDVEVRVIEIITKARGIAPQTPSIESALLVALHNKAHNLDRLNRSDEAESLNLEVLEGSLNPDGSVKVDHRSYQSFLNLRGRIIRRKKDASADQLMEALDIFSHVFQETLETHGIGDADTWVAANNVLSALEALDGDSRVQLTSLELFEALLALVIKQGLPRSACHPEFQRTLWKFLTDLDVRILLLQAPDFERLWRMRMEFVQACQRTQEVSSTYTVARVNATGVVLQARGKFELAEAQHREALDSLKQLSGENSPTNDIRGLFEVAHYNIMLALARQGRVAEALAYRDAHRNDIAIAEDQYDALEVRLERDAEDKETYDQAVLRIAAGEPTSTGQWWQDHAVALGRAQKRYGLLIKPSGTANLARPQLLEATENITTLPKKLRETRWIRYFKRK
ncbi:hypothetical protein EDB81DRAFT_653957 [Dactylonectria macrodidyma]|uniref:PNPLA domain-containing protein n=1 Tax=Dactylonectria macrodidyma TaxID=307937 RepID=A0A9P9ER50_9HYPO|nr:hypothetical protein EDB81DRAFT_653957 [Dactylonectria macrodidyma]